MLGRNKGRLFQHFINCDFMDRSCDANLAKLIFLPKFTGICWIFRHPEKNFRKSFPKLETPESYSMSYTAVWLSILPSLKLLAGNCQFNRFQGLWLCLVMYLQSCSRWFGIDFGMWIRIHMAFRLWNDTVVQCPSTRKQENTSWIHKGDTLHSAVQCCFKSNAKPRSNVFQSHRLFHFMFPQKASQKALEKDIHCTKTTIQTVQFLCWIFYPKAQMNHLTQEGPNHSGGRYHV